MHTNLHRMLEIGDIQVFSLHMIHRTRRFLWIKVTTTDMGIFSTPPWRQWYGLNRIEPRHWNGRWADPWFETAHPWDSAFGNERRQGNPSAQEHFYQHLSKENNFPELAFETVKSSLQEKCIIAGKDVYLGVALRDRPSEAICVWCPAAAAVQENTFSLILNARGLVCF